jgi:hypothetical protein
MWSTVHFGICCRRRKFDCLIINKGKFSNFYFGGRSFVFYMCYIFMLNEDLFISVLLILNPENGLLKAQG